MDSQPNFGAPLEEQIIEAREKIAANNADPNHPLHPDTVSHYNGLLKRQGEQQKQRENA